METGTYVFEADALLRKQAVKALRANSPVHKILVVLMVLCCIWIVVSYILLNKQMAGREIAGIQQDVALMMRQVLVICLTFLVAVLPLILIGSVRWRMVDGTLTQRAAETLTLDDLGIGNSYMFSYYKQNKPGRQYKNCNTYMYYKDIVKIEHYRKENALKVYGTVYFCDSPGAPGKDDVIRKLNKPTDAYRVFFLYYDNAEVLMQLLSEKTGIPVIGHDSCTVSLQEIQNKGVD